MKSFIRKVFKVASGETVDLEGVELWEVRWNSVNRCFAGILRDWPSVQVFTNKADANHFAGQLKEALKLLENRGFDDEIEVTKK